MLFGMRKSSAGQAPPAVLLSIGRARCPVGENVNRAIHPVEVRNGQSSVARNPRPSPVKLAAAHGRLEGLGTAMQSLETRAAIAGSRVTTLLAERAPPATARNKRGQRDVQAKPGHRSAQADGCRPAKRKSRHVLCCKQQ